MARSKVTSTADAPRHSGFGPTVAVNLLGSAKCADNALQPVNRNWLKQYVVAEAGRYRHVDGNTAVLKAFLHRRESSSVGSSGRRCPPTSKPSSKLVPHQCTPVVTRTARDGPRFVLSELADRSHYCV